MTKLRPLFVFLFLLLVGCNGNRVFEEFKDLPAQTWAANDSIDFLLPALDISENTGLIGIRFKDNYAFTNFYIKLISQDSSGLVLEEKLVNMVLFNPKSGKPQGRGFGNTYTSYDTLDFAFPPATSKVTLLQYMREEQLSGIEAIGLKLLK